MWSFRERLDLKPTCVSLSLESVASVYLVNIKLQKRLPTIQSIVIPRQLLQSEMSSFFGSVIITTFVSSSGGHSFFQALCDKIRICCVFGGQASRLKCYLDQLLYHSLVLGWLVLIQKVKIHHRLHLMVSLYFPQKLDWPFLAQCDEVRCFQNYW